jgi:hypothetical protein
MLFFVWAPSRHPKPKRTQTEAGKTDARKKRTKGKNERKWTQSKNGGKQQSGALIGVRGKRPAIEVFLDVEVIGFKVWAQCTHCI